MRITFIVALTTLSVSGCGVIPPPPFMQPSTTPAVNDLRNLGDQIMQFKARNPAFDATLVTPSSDCDECPNVTVTWKSNSYSGRVFKSNFERWCQERRGSVKYHGLSTREEFYFRGDYGLYRPIPVNGVIRDSAFCMSKNRNVIAAKYDTYPSSAKPEFTSYIDFYDAERMKALRQYVSVHKDALTKKRDSIRAEAKSVAAREAEENKARKLQLLRSFRPGQIVRYLDREARVIKLVPPDKALIEVGGTFVTDIYGNTLPGQELVSIDSIKSR